MTHQQLLQGLLQRILLALAFDKQLKAFADEELLGNVERYLHRAVEGARKLLPQDTSAVGESLHCEDDSADDE